MVKIIELGAMLFGGLLACYAWYWIKAVIERRKFNIEERDRIEKHWG